MAVFSYVYFKDRQTSQSSIVEKSRKACTRFKEACEKGGTKKDENGRARGW